MHTLRTRFKKEIVAEFLPSVRKSNKVIIFCDGMPSLPNKRRVMESFAKKGYWCFHPRYRGTWESGGKFLKFSPEKDVLDIIDQLPKGFADAWSGKKYRVPSPEVYLVGTSFGGAAVLLASRDKRVKKVIAVSPLIDWRAQSKTEPLSLHIRRTENAFGEAYRLVPGGWNKLKTGKFYNPAIHADEIDGKKAFIIHAKDDKVVPLGPTVKFAQAIGAKLLLLKKGGHLSPSIIMKPRSYKKVKKFLGK